jgi:acetyl esterase/lipase
MNRPSIALCFVLATLPALRAQQLPPEPSETKVPVENAAPYLADLAYGPFPENRVDIWQAKGEGPRPLLVQIHGGGWRGGNKSVTPSLVKTFLDKGISVASVEYRLAPANPLPAPVHDAARALQYLRSRAAELNIDKTKIALSDGSAGACTSMWLLMHDDLADPKAADPVLRESTRVIAAYVTNGQTSIDPKVIEPWLGPKVLDHLMIANAVGEPNIAAALQNYENHAAAFREFSPINHVGAGDPPLFMSYSADMSLPSKNAIHGIHHPVYGVKMKEACDAAGVECHLLIPGSSKSEHYKGGNAFLIGKLLE